MNQSRSDEISLSLIYYLRAALVCGVVAGISIALCFVIFVKTPVSIDVINLFLLLFAIPGYLILPGLIYKPFVREKAFSGVAIERIIYYSITVVSIGIVPSVVYFFKYDSKLNAVIRNKET